MITKALSAVEFDNNDNNNNIDGNNYNSDVWGRRAQ